MASILYRMANGIPGDSTRPSVSTIESQIYNSALPFSVYGVPGKIAAGKFVPITTGDAAAAVYGFLVRPFPTQGVNASDPLGTSVPPTVGLCDVMKRGYINVKNNNGTAALNGIVYARVAAPTGPKPLGGIEAVADSTNTIIIANAYFTGPADANGNAEVAYNL